MNNPLSKKKNIDLIDLLKGFAILSVIYLHSNFSNEVSKAVLAPFLFNLAVPIFMIVSGFTYSISLSKIENNNSLLKSYYSFKNLYKKLIRILPCYFITLTAEIIIQPFKFTDIKSIFKFLYFLCTGGYTFPGSYYISYIIQLIFIFPLLKICYNKFKEKSLLIAAVIQFAFEALTYYANVPLAITRILVFRDIFFVICGIFIFEKYRQKEIKKKWAYLASFLLGIGYIILICYFERTPKFILSVIPSRAMPTALYLVPVIMLLLFKFGEKSIKPIFTIIGKASYHIFLMQMLYFGIVSSRIGISRPIINFIVGIAFSASLGIIMYFAEKQIIKMIKNKRLKSV